MAGTYDERPSTKDDGAAVGSARAPSSVPHPAAAGLRWYAKKLARHAVALGSLAARPGGGGRVRGLMYHRFGGARRDPFCVEPRLFRGQMQWLAARGLPISLDETLAAARGERTLARDRVLVTIDDGWRSLLDAAPVLAAEGIPAVAFLSVGAIDGAGPPAPGAAERALTWSEVEDLRRAGVSFGSHGLTHRSLTRLAPDELRQEAVRSREALEQRLGTAVTSFAYPYGTRADFSPAVAHILAASGYQCAFTAQHGAIGRGAPLYELPRIKVEGGEGAWMFRRLCRGGLDPWGRIDQSLWRWQARPA